MLASLKNFAEKSGKSVEEVEKLWKTAKGIVRREYKDIPRDSDQFYKLSMGTLKNMLGLKENTNIGKMMENETLTFEDLIDKELDKLNEEADADTKKDMEDDESDEDVDEEGNPKKKKKKKDMEDDDEDEKVDDSEDDK